MPHDSPAPRRYIVIQRNARSGSGKFRHLLVDLVRSLRQQNLRPRVFKDRNRLDRWLADTENRDQLLALVAAGGDGTVNDLINRHPGMPLAVLPLGTENLLARFLGIPKSGAEVARIIAAGRTRTLDLCRIGERRFALMASIGFDADVVHRVHAGRTGNISHLTYFKPIWESWRKYEYPTLKVRLDDEDRTFSAKLVVVVNTPAYALGLPVARSACCDDGLLDVRLFERGSAFQMLRYFYKVFRGTHENSPDVRSLRGKRVRIESDLPVPLQADGDPVGMTPVEIDVLPHSLEVFVPERT